MNGSVHKIPDRPKPWRARYRGPDGVEHSKTYRRKVDAERWLRGELGKTDRGAWIDPSAGEVDFADWSAGWLRGLILKPKTRDGYESLLRSRVLPRFGPVPIARITPGEVRAWMTDMTDEGLSAARIRQARQVLHAALEQAVTDGLLARDPTAQVKPPAVHRRRQLFLTAGELAALTDACEDRQEHMGALVLLLGWSGLRWGEAVALRWSAVNPDRRRVRVKASATEVAGRLEWGTPKTHQARTVIVPRFVIDRLGPKGEPDELVFTAPKGGPLRRTNFRDRVWPRHVGRQGCLRVFSSTI